MNDILKLRNLVWKLASQYSCSGQLELESICYDIYSRVLFLEHCIRTPNYVLGVSESKLCCTDCRCKDE